MKRESKVEQVKEKPVKTAKEKSVKQPKEKPVKPVKEKPVKPVKEKPVKQPKEKPAKPVKEKKSWWPFGKKKKAKEVPQQNVEVPKEDVDVKAETDEITPVQVVSDTVTTTGVTAPIVEEVVKVPGSTEVLVSGYVKTTLASYNKSLVRATRKVAKEITPIEIPFVEAILPLIDHKTNAFVGDLRKYKKAVMKTEGIYTPDVVKGTYGQFEAHIPLKQSMLLAPRIVVMAKNGEKPYISQGFIGREGKSLFGVSPFEPDEISVLSIKPIYDKE